MNFSFDFNKILGNRIEAELLKNKKAKPLVLMLKKYGIEGVRAMEFIADLATVAQQMQQEEAEQ